MRLRNILVERDSRCHPDETVLSVYRDLGVIRKDSRTDNFNKTPEDRSAYKLVMPGDVVVNKMKAWQGSIGVSDLRGIVSGDYLVCRVLGGVDRRYLHHLLRSAPLVAEYGVRSVGIRPSQWRLYWDGLADISVALPELERQREIADYLDRDTARIDALIAAKKRMAALVDERLRAWTFGSLEEWRGVVVPLKSVARWVEGPGIMTHEFRDEGVPLLRIRNLVGDTIDLNGCGHLDPAMTTARWNHLRVRTGELVVSGSARSGTPVVVPHEADGAVPYTGLIRIWPRTSELERDYLRLFLSSWQFDAQIDRLKTGVGLQHWGPYHLSQLRIPLPPRESQLTISEEFRRQETRTHQLHDLVDAQVALLHERRRTLITAAVTGELAIPVAA